MGKINNEYGSWVFEPGFFLHNDGIAGIITKPAELSVFS
jgi:hypothetical protein